MDFDMFVQGNDFDLSDVTAEQISGDAKQAVVRAQFKNFGKDETVIFNLLHDDQGWMIDESPPAATSSPSCFSINPPA